VLTELETDNLQLSIFKGFNNFVKILLVEVVKQFQDFFFIYGFNEDNNIRIFGSEAYL